MERGIITSWGCILQLSNADVACVTDLPAADHASRHFHRNGEVHVLKRDLVNARNQ